MSEMQKVTYPSAEEGSEEHPGEDFDVAVDDDEYWFGPDRMKREYPDIGGSVPISGKVLKLWFEEPLLGLGDEDMEGAYFLDEEPLKSENYRDAFVEALEKMSAGPVTVDKKLIKIDPVD